jgi:hypothetical protein
MTKIAPTKTTPTKIAPIDFKPELVRTMKSALNEAVFHIDKSSGRISSPATKARIASRIVKTAAEGVTDPGQLKAIAIEEGLCPAD